MNASRLLVIVALICYVVAALASFSTIGSVNVLGLIAAGLAASIASGLV